MQLIEDMFDDRYAYLSRLVSSPQDDCFQDISEWAAQTSLELAEVHVKLSEAVARSPLMIK